MQVVELPRVWMILSFFIGWIVIQVGFSLLGNKIPDKYFNEKSLFFRTRGWELFLYRKIFKIQRWKRILPDGAGLFRKGFVKKNLKERDPGYLKAFIKETCRAEFVHWLQLCSFWVFGLWSPGFIIWIMLGYAMAVNLPCIITQRYNRPRLARLYRMTAARQSGVPQNH